ncbi:hypothetical protein A2333_01430 [Candidatus Wolfebacteria bacterium RIFOXYB2_FULL_49_7]|uniref:Uncharacterized protein n=1 Tax=Candidatus Wolfebacteria bacterium RIFOXYB1_FULL_54_12 TaxID=1802559 RepID=A0A1F8DXL6_9BACT|nr:MAG: hypothetical protein A2372_02745 [Candidatus Wolfebacteria bacterium RIFOXYB1_FULL_54_12]OGM96020.1 MAG: hypothetical protein A2333_01430 [Candidatus Wolfebacteria bacterium RIFOXYB2_FULL_49_7]
MFLVCEKIELDPRLRGDDRKKWGMTMRWIPAFAGMTEYREGCHSDPSADGFRISYPTNEIPKHLKRENFMRFEYPGTLHARFTR